LASAASGAFAGLAVSGQAQLAAVRLDVGIARATLPPSISISGMVYDVQSGLVEVVDPLTTE
jgi:carbonic anhydrase